MQVQNHNDIDQDLRSWKQQVVSCSFQIKSTWIVINSKPYWHFHHQSFSFMYLLLEIRLTLAQVPHSNDIGCDQGYTSTHTPAGRRLHWNQLR